MLGGACVVVAGSPFGLAWYLVPPLIYAGIGTALIGLAIAPSRWLRVTAHPVANYLMFVSGGCLLMGWYGGWAALLAVSGAAALASLLLDRRNRWRTGLCDAGMVIVVISLALR